MNNLIQMAMDATKNCYVPYSNYYVGCVLVTKDNKAYTGCNIENSAYSPCNCAERTAFFKAISNGEKHFKYIVIVGGKNKDFKDFCYPCGVCRQVMKEFCEKDFKIIIANKDFKYEEYLLEELLPKGFDLNENV